MKLSIYGDRLSFYQWDTGQRLIVDGADMCEEVHFATRTLNGALVVRIENQDGLRVANVPNILLQSAYPITAYVYYRSADNRETRYARVFGVKSREKPSDYVYTETEVLTYKKLEEKLDQMQGLIGDLTDLETESKDNLVDAINKTIYTLPPMTGTALGGAIADPAQESDTQPVRIGADHKLYTAPGGASSSSDVLYVTLTMGEGGTITADKTFAEITEAAGSGMCVIARPPSGEILYLAFYNDTFAFFLLSNGLEFFYVRCLSSDTWELEFHTLNSRDVGAIPSPSTATVGQTIVVKAVDSNGVPTEWEAADMPSGGGSSGALAGLTIADNYDIELISHVIIDQDNIPTAGITVTQKDDGSAFAYDGLLIWSDAKSSGAYTTFNFNGYTNYSVEFTHGNAKFLNLYITDGVTMLIQNGGTARNVIKQSYADTGSQFFPEIAFQRVPEKFTSFKIGADGIASVKFYKACGLARQ